MSFEDDEQGVETSRPREGIELIVSELRAYRIATGTRDITINGYTYRALPGQRDEVSIASSKNEAELLVRLPMAHDVPRRWLAGTPPRQLEVNVYRKQLNSGEYERIFTGLATGLAGDSRSGIATLRVLSRMTAQLDRRLPNFAVSRLCNHVLYDRNCRVVRASHTVSTTVTSVQGRKIKIASISGQADGWADRGDVLHVATNERVTVLSQVGVQLELKAAVVDLQVGDAVEVSAGCAHDITTCREKFDNKVNYGGAPQLNSFVPGKPTGYGIYTSE